MYSIVGEIDSRVVPGGLLPAHDWNEICGPLKLYMLYSASDVSNYLNRNGGVTIDGLRRMGINAPGTCQRMLNGLLYIARTPQHIVSQLRTDFDRHVERLQSKLVDELGSNQCGIVGEELTEHIHDRMREMRCTLYLQYKDSYKNVLTPGELDGVLEVNPHSTCLLKILVTERRNQSSIAAGNSTPPPKPYSPRTVDVHPSVLPLSDSNPSRQLVFSPTSQIDWTKTIGAIAVAVMFAAM
jgi:hypothetical protein